MAVAELRFRAMASDAHVVVVDGPPDACETARRAAHELEAIWSRFVDSSDIQRLNHSNGQPVQVQPMTVTLLETMIEAGEVTDGRFDPTTLAALLVAGYDCSIDDPTARTVLPNDSYRSGHGVTTVADIEIGDDRMITLPPMMAIDAGGIGKGLAADHICAELLARGAAGVMISIGGDLAAVGTPPESEGWRVDIEHPLTPDRLIAQIAVSGGGVATSSTMTRRWSSAGREHHHTIDPATGESSSSDLAAVTVVASCGWQAEVHATAMLLGGSADFGRYAQHEHLEALAVTTSGEIHTTPALAATLLTETARS